MKGKYSAINLPYGRITIIMMMKNLTIDEVTYKRLASIRSEISHEKKRDVDYGDVINELINVYHDHLAFSGENAGG